MERLQQKLVTRDEGRVLLKTMVDDQDGLLYFYCESQRLTTVSHLWRAERRVAWHVVAVLHRVSENKVHERDTLALGQKAEVTDAHKAFGKDVQ